MFTNYMSSINDSGNNVRKRARRDGFKLQSSQGTTRGTRVLNRAVQDRENKANVVPADRFFIRELA